ncbi:hypothetical protein PaG_04082 [Moesziomyces aphidis]|uniref:Metallo-beta-lactamase domain-containing protein n=1 Tax=Moesziomyces aphidis TaxID=84754 RepID=W3VJ80_MOEAP|nr:hypothetical protein PaG_04082 [Moesziomyces aphidis]
MAARQSGSGLLITPSVGLTAFILSHARFDHYGNLLDFPTSTPVFVGAGTREWIGGGDEAAEKGEKGLVSFPSSFLKDRTFIETDQIKAKAAHGARVKHAKVGPFERAWDWLGDGSLFIASAEGHCPGHQVMLAKTSHDPTPSWVLLSGDAAHQQALYHPLPAPLELGAESLCSTRPHHDAVYRSVDDLRATAGFFDRASADAIVDGPIPVESAACMQEFPDKAMRTLAALSRLEACHDVMVVLRVAKPKCIVQNGKGELTNDALNPVAQLTRARAHSRARAQIRRRSCG